MITYLIILAVSFIVVFLITPTIRYVALKFYVIDKINNRKIHKKLVTKLGGLAIFLGYLGGLFVILSSDTGFFKANFYTLVGLLTCSFLMLILGIYDDLQGSGAMQKLIVQIVISILAVKSGFILKGINAPGLFNIEFGFLSVPLTILWLVGMTNSINLIDGLDGLAPGISAITAFFIFLIGLLLKDNFVIYISLAVTGACLAFLKYNFYPAKIFMGDTGSLFLGLIIAILAIYRSNPASSANHYFIPTIIILILPLIDTTLAIIRRFLKKQNILQGDASHIHHYFLKKGLTQSQTVITFYVATFFLGVTSLALTYFLGL